MKRIMFLCSIATVFHIHAKQIITFFIKPYPMVSTQDIQATIQHLKKPGVINGHIMRKKSGYNAGIFGTYAGYLALSNALGQMSFPRKQEQPSFHLIVTKKIEPVYMLKSIINHWNVPQGTDVAAYTINRKQDPETKLYYWDVAKSKLADNRQVPLKGIVLFAQPQNIYVPIGATPTDKSPQLVLPQIYAKQTIDDVANAMQVLSIRQFFDPIRSITQKKPFGTTHILVP